MVNKSTFNISISYFGIFFLFVSFLIKNYPGTHSLFIINIHVKIFKFSISVLQAFCLNIFEKLKANKTQAFKKSQEFYTKNSTYRRFFTQNSGKNLKIVSVFYQKLLRNSTFWENFQKNLFSIQQFKIISMKTIQFAKKDLQKHMQLMERLKNPKNSWKNSRNSWKKTQGILEKTQDTGGLRLDYPPKKCPNKKPAVLALLWQLSWTICGGRGTFLSKFYIDSNITLKKWG